MIKKTKLVFSNWLFQVLCFAVLYYCFARLSLLLAFENTNASPVWFPSGIAFAVLLFFGFRLWPSILLGAFTANTVVFTLNAVSSSIPILAISLCIAVGNTLEAVIGVYLFRQYFSSSFPMDKSIDAFRFIALILVACLFGSIIGSLSLLFFGFISLEIYFLVWFTWWLGDTGGIFVLSTLFLPQLKTWRADLSPSLRRVEIILFWVFTLLLSYYIFGGGSYQSVMNGPLAYVAIPVVIWAVFRYGELGLGATVLTILAAALWGTLHSFGPFIQGDLNQSLLLLQGFVIIMTITGLILLAALRESKEAKMIILEKESRFRRLIEKSSDIIMLIDSQGIIVYSSPSTARILGYELDDYLGRNIFEFVHPDDLDSIQKLFHQIIRQPKKYVYSGCRYRHRDNSWVWLEGSGINLLGDKNIKAVVINCRDVTERKYAEEQHRYIIEAALDAVISIDEKGRVIEWNRQAEATFGWSKEEIVGLRLSDTIIPPVHRERHIKGIENFMTTGKGPLLNKRVEINALHRDGYEFPVELSITPIKFKDRTAFSGFLRDISERKLAEERLKKYAHDLKESNEDLENFAFVASHDLQEPLRIVTNYIQMFAKRYEEKMDATATKYVNYIVDNVSRMQEMINGLLEYSRIGRKEQIYSEIDSGAACDKAMTNLNLLIKKKEAVVKRDELPMVNGNEIELVQLFQNLIGNALKYCKKKPEIRISCIEKAGWWHFSVEDNGIGIEADYFDQIFDVFKRLHTKAEFPGTGMGLSICKKIVEKHGGRIWVESKMEEGSTFCFTIPKHA